MKGTILSIVSFLFLSVSSMAQVKVWTFKECLDRAIEQNITLNQQRLNSDINEVAVKQSQSVRIPTLNFTGSQGFNWGRSIDPSTNQFVNQYIRTNNFGLSGSVTLFNGFQNANTIKQSKLNYEAGLMDVASVQNNISINLSSAYLGVLLGYEQVEVMRNQVILSETQLAKTQELLNSGKLAELDLYKITAQLESDRYNLVNAENQVILSKISLKQIMNLPNSDSFEIERISIDVVPQYVESNSEDLYNTAITVLPSVKSASLQKSSSEVGLKISRGAYLPRLSLNGNLTTNYSTSRTLNTVTTTIQTIPIGYLQSTPTQIVVGSVPSTSIVRGDYPWARQINDNLGKSLMLTLSVPILNQRQVRSNVDRAEINIKRSELNEQSVLLQLRNDISQAHADMKASYRKFQASEKQVDALDKAFSGTELKYSLGIATSTDLVVAKSNLVNGQAALLQAKYEYLFNVKVLDLYVGKQITF